jgi:hypothetical protein
MIVNKQFAQNGALDIRMDQLLEVLVQLLEEPNPPASDQAILTVAADLHSQATRAIHVSVDNTTTLHQTELGSCR